MRQLVIVYRIVYKLDEAPLWIRGYIRGFGVGDNMFKKYFKDRIDIIRAVIVLIFLVMAFRLADLRW